MFVTDTENLEIDRPLRFDLTTIDGRLLATAGTPVTQKDKSDWLLQGIHRVCSYIEADFSERPEHLRPYDPAIVRRLEARIQQASESVEEHSELIRRNEPAESKKLHQLAEDMLTDLDLDVAAALAAALGEHADSISDRDRAVAKRCSRMSLLSMAIGTELGLSDDDRQTIGVAGLLHDISLLTVTNEAVAKVAGTFPFQHEFLDHPLASSHLLESILGIDKKICIAVAQVHEQPNGGGFPRCLPSHRIMFLSKILAVVDAYLTLTSKSQPKPLPEACNLQPCDCVAYLIHNAKNGRFDTLAIKGLVKSLSLYPIGSLIELSNGSKAVVLRSNSEEPSQPIVRVDDSSFSIIDLRRASVKIVRPLTRNATTKNRLSKSALENVLFR